MRRTVYITIEDDVRYILTAKGRDATEPTTKCSRCHARPVLEYFEGAEPVKQSDGLCDRCILAPAADTFRQAAVALLDAYEQANNAHNSQAPDIFTAGYPFEKSFDELLFDIVDWSQSIAAARTTAPIIDLKPQPTAETFWRALGFYEQHTGGGCTAYQRDYADGYVMVTDGNTAAPKTVAEPVLLGFYRTSDDGNEGVVFQCPNSDHALTILRSCIWLAPAMSPCLRHINDDCVDRCIDCGRCPKHETDPRMGTRCGNCGTVFEDHGFGAPDQRIITCPPPDFGNWLTVAHGLDIHANGSASMPYRCHCGQVFGTTEALRVHIGNPS